MNVRDTDIPANAFTHRFSVRQNDIDDLGHAGNVSWVRWVNEAAAAHSEAVGLGLEAYRQRGVIWVVRRHDIEYLGQAFVGDAIDAVTWVARVRGATSLRKTAFYKPMPRKLLGRAETTWVLLSLPAGKPIRVPAELARRYGFAC
jgi:acyl-CoA thioester hydrolase